MERRTTPNVTMNNVYINFKEDKPMEERTTQKVTINNTYINFKEDKPMERRTNNPESTLNNYHFKDNSMSAYCPASITRKRVDHNGRSLAYSVDV